MSAPANSNDVKKHYELNSRYVKVGDKNVWVEFTALARDYNAVNLGQVIIIFNNLKFPKSFNFNL